MLRLGFDILEYPHVFVLATVLFFEVEVHGIGIVGVVGETGEDE